MEYTRKDTMMWNARVAAASDHASRMMKLGFDSWSFGTAPVMEPSPPPAGEQPMLAKFEEFVAQHCPTLETGGSSIGGGDNYGITPGPSSPITPIQRGGGGDGLAGNGAGSSVDLGFAGLAGGKLGGGRPGA